MSWNYRIIKSSSEPFGDIFGIHEVYYDGDGKPKSVTENAIFGPYEEIKDLKIGIEMMLNDLKRFPVPLDENIFKDNQEKE